MNRERALHFLSLGLPHTQVASIVGVSPSRISQLLSEPSVKEILALRESETQERNFEEERIEGKQIAVKNQLLDSLAKRSDEATFMEIARAYEIICRAESLKKNPVPIAGTQIFGGVTVQIALPQRNLQEEIEITKDKEVISVGGRPLLPLGANQVTQLFKSMKEINNEPSRLQSCPT